MSESCAGAAHRLGDFRESLFGAADRRRQPLRLGQSEQSQRAIGLELDQALHQRAGALVVELAIDQQDAHEASGIGNEVGRVKCGAVGILGHRKAGAVEQLLGRDFFAGLGNQLQVDGGDQRTGLRHQPHRRGKRSSWRLKRHIGRRGSSHVYVVNSECCSQRKVASPSVIR